MYIHVRKKYLNLNCHSVLGGCNGSFAGGSFFQHILICCEGTGCFSSLANMALKIQVSFTCFLAVKPKGTDPMAAGVTTLHFYQHLLMEF